MKRVALFLTLLLLLTGCSGQELLKEPPAASVLCGDQRISATIHNDSWDYKNLDGSVSSYFSDGLAILQTEKEAVTTDESTATVRFGTEPQSFTVECWPEAKRGELQAEGQFLPVKDHQFSLRSGSYIYAIRASWETKRYNGSCAYVVVIDSTAEEPVLTEPPALTVTCEDKTATAKLGTYSWTHGEGDNKVSIQSDGVHPLLCLTAEDRITFKKDAVYLNFEVPPDRIESYCWNDTDLGKTIDGNPITDYWVGGRRMKPANGSYIIEIRAFWESHKGYKGNANYCFYIHKLPEN